jgi:putative FmdB family regulatory protein
MPIYAYRCASCGHAKDVLQKLSDPLLSTCPSCGAESFRKQLTAAGFQLKGSGWYVTDFKGGPPAGKPDGATPDVPKPEGEAAPAVKPGAETAPAAATKAKSDAGPPSSSPSTGASPAPTPSGPAPAAQ